MSTLPSPTSAKAARRPFRPYGAALEAWKTRKREVLLAGPGDTGKSRAILEKLHYCADKYPGLRGLIVRKTRSSLAQSAMVTYEQKVLPEGWLGNLIRFNTVDQQYEYPNGSIIAVGGMDKAEKVLSSEWDFIYPQEATELTENDWEFLTMRLRNGKMPYQQIMGDCNPSYPTHWLKGRCDRGATLMLNARHEDNPSITEERLDVLRSLTGVRYLRLYLGQWTAAEGMVYEGWDRAVHLVSLQQLIDWNILFPNETINPKGVKRVIAGADWGWTNPGVLQVYAVDGDNRLYQIHEIYQTQRDDDWWVAQARDLKDRYGVEVFVCDPSEPAYIAKFNASYLNAVEAINDIKPGISAVQSRLKIAGDGRPRLYIYEQALKERDENRVKLRQPCGTEGEINEYVWPKEREGHPVKEVPVKVNDHACLIAGTLITTLHGDIPIEHVRAGDYVLTRYGYRRIKVSGMTAEQAKVYTLSCSDGTQITGTGNHPVYVHNIGYIPLHAVRYGSIIEMLEYYHERNSTCLEYTQRNQRLLSTKGSHSDVIQTRQEQRQGTTILPTQNIGQMAFSDCIKRYGKTLTGLFQKDITSIIEIIIRSTTQWTILNAFLDLIISLITAASQLAKRSASTSKTSDLLLQNGIAQISGENGTVSMDAKHGNMPKSEHILVRTVARSFHHVQTDLIRLFSVGTTARPSQGASRGSIILPQLASNVDSHLLEISTTNKNSVLCRAPAQTVSPILAMKHTPARFAERPLLREKQIDDVVQGHAQGVTALSIKENEQLQPVYNLTVETNAVGEEGEYFANGILVHNCDTMRYVCMWLNDPTLTAEQHIEAIQRRLDLSRKRVARPVQGGGI